MDGFVKKILIALFSESSEISAMRFMSILALIIAGYLAIYGIQNKSDLSTLSILCSVFVGAAFTGKVMQKKVEVTRPENPNSDSDGKP